MKRLLTASIVVGILGAATVAWEARDTIAVAAVEDRADSQADAIRAFASGCVDGLGVVTGEMQAGIWRMSCTPSLGLGPAVKRRVRR